MDNLSVMMVVLVILLALSAFFSSSETAYSSLNRIRITKLAEEGNDKARNVLELFHNFDRLLSAILIGNNIVNIASSSIATVLFVLLFWQHRRYAIDSCDDDFGFNLWRGISKTLAKKHLRLSHLPLPAH